ncbi:MAG: methyltransferase domain-containing protein [Verrucomicrobiota bacterium]
MSDNPIEPWRREIDQNEFFYVQKDNYDEHVELAIPLYREMHQEMVRILRSKENIVPWTTLDLGSGTGKTSAAILSSFSVARLDAMELFDSMQRHAEERLRKNADRVRFLTGDFMELPFDGPYDVCVSALAIHHQRPAGKQFLFRKIHDALAPGGIFIMIDWTNFSDPTSNELAFQSACDTVLTNVRDDVIIGNWIEHWRTKNIPNTVEDQCQWLRLAGFDNVEVILRFWGMAMLVARKPARKE